MANKKKQELNGVKWVGRRKRHQMRQKVAREIGRKFGDSIKKNDFPSFSEYMTAAHKVIGSKNKVELIKGSLVWAKYQNCCPWPAIIKNVYGTKKRASVIWLPAEFPISQSRTSTMALKNIKPFVACYEDNSVPFSILNRPEMIKDFYKARHQAKTINDQKIDPFTAQSLPESIAYKEQLDDTPTNLRNIEAESHDDNDYTEQPESSNSSEHNDSANFLEQSTESEQDNDGTNAKILEVFKSDEAKEVARQLMDGTVETARTKAYALKVNKRTRRSSLLSMPVDRLLLNEAQLEEAVEILETLYETGTDVNFPFIFEVLIPELIIFALRKLFNYSEEEAENALKRT